MFTNKKYYFTHSKNVHYIIYLIAMVSILFKSKNGEF